jgi:hypothetical protein
MMKKLLLIALFNLAFSQSVHAGVELVQVPVACGTIEAVSELLHLKMEKSTTLGKGGNSQGQEVAALFSGSNRWALVTRVSPNRVCVIASGRNWEPLDLSAF